MADLFGMRQVGSLDLLETIAEGMQVEAEQNRQSAQRQAVKATATAQVCHSLGVKHEDLTESQQRIASELEGRMVHGRHRTRGYGFTIDTRGRKPNIP